MKMTSPSVEDRDFDDAALWAVIDSAEATLSSTTTTATAKSKSRARPQTLALKYPNFQSPPTPVSHPSPPLPSPPTSQRHVSVPDPCTRPNKIARARAPELSPLGLVRSPCSAVAKAAQFLPESYLSPQIGKVGFDEASEVSPRGREEGEVMRHCLNATFPSVSLFKDFQNAAMAILEKSDYTLISGNPFIRKSGWRKISFYFNISYEIKDKTIEFDDSRNVQRAEFVVRAHMQGGRFSDGWGSCERREKRFMKPNHDIPSTAETRAKNKACQDLLGIGEYRPGATQFHQ